MSKFLKKIDELTNNSKEPETSEDAALRRAEDAMKQGNASPEQVDLVNKRRKLTKALGNKMDKTTQDLQSEANGDFVPRQGPPAGGDEFVPAPIPPAAPAPAPEPAEPDPLTTEGETFLVNLARKALFVELDEVGLTDTEREHLNKDAKPEDAKKVAKIIRKIIIDQGLSESFIDKANVVLEQLEKKTLE